MDDAFAALYRQHGRRVFATLVRLLGDFDLAEEALHDAFRAALGAMAARRRARPTRARGSSRPGASRPSTRMRRARALRRARDDVAEPSSTPTRRRGALGRARAIEDDRLRLVFTCCHPALAAEAQVALTLREVCGLTTEEIARAFLIAAPTLAQRIVRAKAKIARRPHPLRGAGAGASCRSGSTSVLRVVYLVFNEGYSASSGHADAADLSGEAIRLAGCSSRCCPSRRRSACSR